MTVYGINGESIMDDVNTINEYLTLIFKETGRANLLSEDLKKWGNRVYNLTIGELIVKFELSYNESELKVRKYFESEMLPINSKFHFSNNLYDYPIKGEQI